MHTHDGAWVHHKSKVEGAHVELHFGVVEYGLPNRALNEKAFVPTFIMEQANNVFVFAVSTTNWVALALCPKGLGWRRRESDFGTTVTNTSLVLEYLNQNDLAMLFEVLIDIESCSITVKVSDFDCEVRPFLPFEGLWLKQDGWGVDNRASIWLILLAGRSLYTRMVDGSSRSSSPICVG